MKEIQKRFKFSGSIHDDDVLHSVSLHAEPYKEIAPYYVPVPVPLGSRVPQYSPTIFGKSTKYNPSKNCEGNFMSYKFQPNNNCYNYATNVATNSFAQPGRKTGNPFKEYIGRDVVNGAVSDGLKLVGKTRKALDDYAKKAEKGHFVALMISTTDASISWRGDFHWARLDDLKTSSWSQKDGGDQVTNFDFAGNLIKDPSTANWTVNQGPVIKDNPNDIIISYDFFTYMFVPCTDKEKGITII
jgi:hypothetical protein